MHKAEHESRNSSMKRREFIKTLGVAGVASTIAVGATKLTGASSNPGAPLSSDSNNLKAPFSLAFDPSGNLFVSDPPAYRIVRLDSGLTPSDSFGKPGAHIGRLNFPKGIACDETGLLYVVDSNNGRIQVFEAGGQVKRSVGSIGSIGGSFSTPQGIYVDEKKRMLVADTRNHRIQVYLNFELLSVIGDLGDSNDQFRLPTACSYTPDDEIAVLDSKHGIVKFFGPDTVFKRSFGSEGSAPGQLNLPQGMYVTKDGAVWIADTGNHRLQNFSLDGKLLNVIGKEGSGEAEFRRPTGVVVRDGFLYIADSGNSRVSRIKVP